MFKHTNELKKNQNIKTSINVKFKKFIIPGINNIHCLLHLGKYYFK